MAKASTISVMINKDLVNRLKSTMDENERLHKENLLLLKENKQLHHENECMVIRLAQYEHAGETKPAEADFLWAESAIVAIGTKATGEQWQTKDEQPTEDWSMDED